MMAASPLPDQPDFARFRDRCRHSLGDVDHWLLDGFEGPDSSDGVGVLARF
jgi:hypothetical protein